MDFFYPPELPITSSLTAIAELIDNHQVIVVAGETGSGKTTQLPKLCLQHFLESRGAIGCTQPRRVAALSVADRVKQELAEMGDMVGCKIRFHDKTTRDTRIKFMTDGILLAETKQDPLLRNYRAIIVDEAHERNLNIDFLLGYLYRLLPRRADLKVIITSATIDTDAFSAHFDNAPVYQIDGRTYPVDVLYSPTDQAENDRSYVEHCVEVVCDIRSRSPQGDILVFLPTEKDIRSCCEILGGRLPDTSILPLFGRLQPADQQKIFRDNPQTKIVVATNVAETSITVPGIRYVVDSGLARISTYNPRSRTTSLPITEISQASCNQRSGRAGRLGPGVCFRLFSEENFQSRPEFSTPEIQRANLAEVILQMITLTLGDPFDFPFLESPKPAAIREGFKLLRELGAIKNTKQLTKLGRIMSRWPIDPLISRIIIEATRHGCLREIIIIASALAIQDPRVRPTDKEEAADRAHKSFADPHSDFIVLLNIWNRYHQEHPDFSWSSLKRFCSRNFLSFQRMREWMDLHEQLLRLVLAQQGFSLNTNAASYESIHRSLLIGFFRQCARKKKGVVYQGLASRELRVFPGSHQYGISGEWIMAGAFIETSRLFALTVATIEPEWLETVAAPFCSYCWSNARWQKKTGRIIADETVTLDGLVLSSGRIVNYPKRDKKNIPDSRVIFIQKALVEGNITDSLNFLTHNNTLIKKWQKTEHRLRKRGIVVEESQIFDFYDSALPEHVYDRHSLLKYLAASDERALFMKESDVVVNKPKKNDLVDYPPRLRLGGNEIELRYHFEPGSKVDGILAVIPLFLMETLSPDAFDWLVPGLLEEKTTYLIKGLPKKIRKRVIPVSNAVARALDALEPYQGNFLRELTKVLAKLFDVPIRQGDWPTDLPRHLRMNFVVIDADGKEVMNGDDFELLLQKIRKSPEHSKKTNVSKEDEKLIEDLRNRIFSTWDFADIPRRIPIYQHDKKIGGYLYGALLPIPDRASVSVGYFSSRQEAVKINQEGTYHLIQCVFKEQVKQLKKQCRIIVSGPSSVLLISNFGGAEKTRAMLVRFVLKSVIDTEITEIIDKGQFDEIVCTLTREGLYPTGCRIIEKVMELLRRRQEVYEIINKYEKLSQRGVADRELFADLFQHLDRILPGNFLERIVLPEFENRLRYLKSLAIRAERAYTNPHKDRLKRNKLLPHLKKLAPFQEDTKEMSNECRSHFSAYRHLVDELSVSLFSPEIKTTASVSEKALAQAWQRLESAC